LTLTDAKINGTNVLFINQLKTTATAANVDEAIFMYTQEKDTNN